jgi:carboxymethylenebutenolidase
MMSIGTGASGDVAGYCNDSAGEGRPAVLVLHEWWGVNAQIRGVVDRFANEGYVAFAPDLYRGRVAETPEQAQELVAAGDKAQWIADLARAVSVMQPRKIGVVGFSLGAALALTMAARVSDVVACVAFYGIPRAQSVDVGTIRGRVLGHYARRDTWYSAEQVDELEATLRRADVAARFHRYDAQHSFFNERLEAVHSPEHARVAWDRTLAFLREVLG